MHQANNIVIYVQGETTMNISNCGIGAHVYFTERFQDYTQWPHRILFLLDKYGKMVIFGIGPP